MALFTRCILAAPEPDDGLRISVMSRHTLEDGVTPDPRIQATDLHWPQLAPSPTLVGDYYRRGLSWDEFLTRYRQEMQAASKVDLIARLATMACATDVTILCVEDDSTHCHRGLLAELCKKEQYHLRVEHR